MENSFLADKEVEGDDFEDVLERVRSANRAEISDLFLTALCRYNDLYPDWEICSYTLEKKGDRSEQIDNMIRVLESAKNMPNA